MTNSLTRSEKARRPDTFLSNDANFVAVSYDDSRAVALRVKAAANAKRRSDGQANIVAATAEKAAGFAIGQTVTAPRGVVAAIVAIDGSKVRLDNGSTYIASALTAA